NHSHSQITIPSDQMNLDNLNDLSQYTLHDINTKAIDGVITAHVETGAVANLLIEIDCIDEYNMGYLMGYMMVTCAYSAYLLDVNPFNQPGVEVYKKEIFKLL
ncbi:MAG: glucose-6-phosphate isomerase, partial [Bacilli bacterium]